jgi:hypothetical protein
LANLTPRIRVEVYLPLRYEPVYRSCLSWIIEEFTRLRGGCTVHSNVGGYYLSRGNEVIDDRVSIVYSDFQMDWDNDSDQAEVLGYCAKLKDFLYENLSEEEILISAYPVSHFRDKPVSTRVIHIS